MRTLIADAITCLDRESDPALPGDSGLSIPPDENGSMLLVNGGEPVQKPDLLIAGCGGTGNAVLNRLFDQGFSGPRTLVMDPDPLTFQHAHAGLRYFLEPAYFRPDEGDTPGGSERVAAAAEHARPDLEPMIGSPRLCLIVAGMGGDAGGGLSPEVARIAKLRGAIVTALVTLPSRHEKRRYEQAQKDLDGLLETAGSVFVLDLNYLAKVLPKDLPRRYLYSVADQVLAGVIRNLYGRVCTPSMVNLDVADLADLLSRGGYGTILFGETREENFVEGVYRDCLKNRMKNIPLSRVTGCIVLIEGYYAGIFYSDQIATAFCYNLDPHAQIIWGAWEDHAIPEGETRAWVLVSTGRRSLQHQDSPRR